MEGVQDPYAILGVSRDASPVEVATAWRRLAKEWHPDLRGDAAALARMAQLNAAYEAILAERRGTARRHGAGEGGAAATGSRDGAPQRDAPRPAGRARRGAGWWLPTPVRRALGPELLRALREREAVREVVPCQAAGSEAVLVLTDGRLLWLLDDLVLGRIRSLPLAAVEGVERPRARRWRRGAAVRVRAGAAGVTFAGLTAERADAVARAIGSAAPALR
jgi:hypothetical protein